MPQGGTDKIRCPLNRQCAQTHSKLGQPGDLVGYRRCFDSRASKSKPSTVKNRKATYHNPAVRASLCSSSIPKLFLVLLCKGRLAHRWLAVRRGHNAHFDKIRRCGCMRLSGVDDGNAARRHLSEAGSATVTYSWMHTCPGARNEVVMIG